MTSDSTTQDVIKMALEKSGKAHKAGDFVLVEECEEEERMVGNEEIPLSLRSKWKNDSDRFVLKQVRADPSWRARLATKSVADKERKLSIMQKGDSNEISDDETPTNSENPEKPEDKFLVCIFNISSSIAHAMFHVSKSSTAADVIKLALQHGRRNLTDHPDFVLVEEVELKDFKKKGKKLVHRIVNNDENLYLVQSCWKDSGKLTLMEKKETGIKLKGLEVHQSIRETQSDPVQSPRLRRPNNLVNRVRRFSRSIYHQSSIAGETAEERETVSDGDISEDEDKPDRARKVSKAFRAVKIW